MRKIVLIKPKSSYIALLPRVPLSLLFIGTELVKRGYDVKIIDTNIEKYCDKLILNECKDAYLVGVTVLTSEVTDALRISRLIKDNYRIPIVWGGIHPSLFAIMTCESELVDYVIDGEGEYALCELIKRLEELKSIDDVKGLVYKYHNMVLINKKQDYIDINKLSIDYSLIRMERYFEGGTWRRAVDVQTSRGCPYNCKYCVNTALNTHKIRMMDAVNVVDTCELLIKNYNANYITFVDDNFFINRDRVINICNEIIKRNLKFKWFAEIRADYFKEGFIDNDVLKLSESSGLSNLTIGAESGIPYYLKLIDKQITVEDIINSAKALSKTEIVAAYSFIIGLPNETVKDINENIRFIERLRKIYPNAVYNIGTLRAYPKSELTNEFVQKGIIKEAKTLDDFAKYEINKYYIDSLVKPEWHQNPNYAVYVAKYSQIAYGAYTNYNLKKRIKLSFILLMPEYILHKIALIRLHYGIFLLPIDYYVAKALHRCYYFNVFRKLVRWVK